MNKEFYKIVNNIQQELKAPKNQFNSFGKYNYRSCEDIVEAYKKLPCGLVLTISDDVVLVGDRIYVKATVTLSDGENSISNSALARESLTKKGMDDSQITGTASSYARKYALNGLFCIDDTKDADSMDNSSNQQPVKQQSNQDDDKPWYNEPDYQADLAGITDAIRNGTNPDDIIKEIALKFKIATKYRDMIKAI